MRNNESVISDFAFRKFKCTWMMYKRFVSAYKAACFMQYLFAHIRFSVPVVIADYLPSSKKNLDTQLAQLETRGIALFHGELRAEIYMLWKYYCIANLKQKVRMRWKYDSALNSLRFDIIVISTMIRSARSIKLSPYIALFLYRNWWSRHKWAVILNKLDIYTVDECCLRRETRRLEYNIGLICINALLLHLVL